MNAGEIKKKRLKFSIIDFVIIILFAALIIGMIARYDVADRLFTKTQLIDAKITFTAESLTKAEVSVLKEGSQLHDKNGLFGTLHTLTAENTLVFTEAADGTLVSSESSSLSDINGSILVNVSKSSDGYLLNGKHYIAAGSQFTLKSNGAEITITVLSLNVAN